VPDEVGRPADDLVDERDRVVGHQLVGDRPVDVRRVPMSPPLRQEHVEPIGQRPDVRLEEPRIYEAAVHQDHWIALASLVVPGPHRPERHVRAHGSLPVSVGDGCRTP
jgi:hypothetical protein